MRFRINCTILSAIKLIHIALRPTETLRQLRYLGKWGLGIIPLNSRVLKDGTGGFGRRGRYWARGGDGRRRWTAGDVRSRVVSAAAVAANYWRRRRLCERVRISAYPTCRDFSLSLSLYTIRFSTLFKLNKMWTAVKHVADRSCTSCMIG